ncbi:SUMF1/EgtB/PvdO family nonheme iron enzyme [Nostoc sp. UCD121]|uniref:SUMF1/EgtB/PvdO family nonheme iron enzyme n=1 Tax=unclassified Nostoc TaxID=2593658 RepID=UPI0016282364|nr:MULTISPECIES: SUMF1/EgtB/PvdO family nonheme iron enzyme [unclassified Nostoc]MBC1221800.1 SUMF1/EgtB/PvdO family nonheme iron enzyme [Nostoc sp. UCD120]MBC1279792.1 SUMF1/EgtB/PvdO family nonheme iron enzyme [Nostoc sp. UCD121]MBC1298557.1 SUMF1/EgtB/PvdO family nonheme iron enzyme [Nostoc sp. UCD122]
MAKNWAIAIGINQYDYLQPLNYAKRDALLMQEFLGNEAGFERIFFFSDDSPDVGGKSTRPNRANLRQVFLELFNKPFMEAGDNFWFFFSGHGIRHADRDYLMPCDGNPADIEETAIPINFVAERLRRCGADNVVLILDACRSLGTRAGEGIGRQTAEEARQQGVISIFSCSPQEYSYEIDALKQGAFTTALLEGLGIQGQCATVERLNQYLQSRVPEIVSEHKHARQTPYVIAEPLNKSHLILVPKYATLADIATLKIDAYQAEVNKNLDLAEQLWIRVLAGASGRDTDAIKAIKRIERLRWEPQEPSSPQPRPIIENSTKGISIVEKNPLKTFQFEVVTVNAKGNITNRRNQEAKYFEEDLGNGITLEMVQIPGGTFTMGSPEREAQRQDNESPLHQVTVPKFFMGKYAVTQAQYQAIMGSNPSNFKGEKRPVEQVIWDEAVEFCEKLSQKIGKTYRLPSEAEWEYACRAGTTTPFYFGETITTDLVNYDGNNPYGSAPKGEDRDQTIDVGKFPPNSFGLYDMHGNVWEWCEDVYNSNYIDAPTNGIPWLIGSDNNMKLLRGGGWLFDAWDCRSAVRNSAARASRLSNVGFRVVAVAVA